METPRQEAVGEDSERPAAPGAAQATLANPSEVPSLPDLPPEVLETICAPLELRDRLRLAACCGALWRRGDVASSAALWGALSIQKPLEIPVVQRSLAAWLRRRSAALRTLHLGRTGASPAPLLAGLAGSPLGALSLAGSSAVGLDPESALQPLAALPALSHLDLSACTLRALPAALCAIPSLASLALPSNPHLGAAGPAGWDALGRLAQLTALSLAGCDLELLPAQLGQLAGLQELRVGSNLMLGKSGAVAFQPLSALRRLRRLEAGSCCLAALPPLLSCCAALEALELHANPSLGTASLQSLALLSSITHLDLSSCGLAGLPAPLSGLTTLRALCLAGNALGAGEQGAAAGAGSGSSASVPGGGSSSSGGGSGGFGALSRLTALTSLSLAGCCLPAVPGGLARLSALQSLDLGDNEMLGPGSEGGGWEALWGLSALTTLEISTCGLRRLPLEVSSLSCLRCLVLGSNRLVGERGTGAFDALAHLGSLSFLDLSECWVDHVPAVLGTLRCLRDLNLARNALLGERGSAAFEHLSALRGLTRLDLRNCRLEGGLPAGLGALVSLRELLLSWNGELGQGGRAEAAWGMLALLPALGRLEIVRCGLAAAGVPASMFARGVRVKL